MFVHNDKVLIYLGMNCQEHKAAFSILEDIEILSSKHWMTSEAITKASLLFTLIAP